MDWLENIENPLSIRLPAVAQFSARYDAVRFKPTQSWQHAAILPESLDKAIPLRQAEFIAGRYCAARAMSQLIPGRSDIVGMADDRSPLWPRHLIGSITHANGFVSAVVALKDAVAGIGIDSEKLLTEHECTEIEKVICTAHELELLHETTGAGNRFEIMTLLFSGKESVYKCLHPMVRRFIEFQEVELVSIDASAGVFAFMILTDLHPKFPRGTKLDGTFRVQHDMVHTAIFLRA